MFTKLLDFAVATCGLLFIMLWALYAWVAEPDIRSRHAALCLKTQELPLETLDAEGDLVYACVSSNYRAVTLDEILKNEVVE